jgi:hypothetical protein
LFIPLSQLDFAQFDSGFLPGRDGPAAHVADHIPIPRFSSQISVSDTFVFLVLLLYGGAAAVVVGAIEAFLSSLALQPPPRIVAFNWAFRAVSILITSSVLEFIFGNVVALRAQSDHGHVCGGDLHDGADSLHLNSGIVCDRRSAEKRSANLANVAQALSLDFDNLLRRRMCRGRHRRAGLLHRRLCVCRSRCRSSPSSF